ncbi:LiaF transmembrane domain-containing protein [Leptobacterium sp. I13]|uniref:LiaF transmembrane domain-containing protein n=1 Tax=Leptobacterium meishanense TaxID=3128904 RepID=UPI0030ED496E
MNSKENYQEHRSKKRSIIGFIFIAIGGILIAKKAGIVPESINHIIISWQMLLILIGTINIITRENYRAGLILISIGTFFILPKIFNIPFEVREMFWPAIFVVIGVLMISVRNRHRSIGRGESSENFIDLINIFSGGKRKITSEKFIGGKVTSILGGSEIDLTSANIQEKEAIIDVYTMFGGCEIVVPRDWDVQVEVTSIFGGFDDKRGLIENSKDASAKVLKIKGYTIFGGGEVKSY